MAEEEYIPSVAVAALDVLGVKKLVAKADECRLALRVLSRFVRNATESRMYAVPTAKGAFESTHAVDAYLGDAVYLFGDPALDIRTQVLRLAVRVATLIWFGLQGDERFLLRAGIAVGDVRRRVLSTGRGSLDVRIGTAMVAAHELEASQCWVGGAIDQSAPIDDEIGHWAIDCSVPRHTGATNARALNWITKGQDRSGLERALRDAVSTIGLSADSQRKLENTLSFVDHVYRRGLFAPFEFDLEA
jgi:class 3 adenylate cyclase